LCATARTSPHMKWRMGGFIGGCGVLAIALWFVIFGFDLAPSHVTVYYAICLEQVHDNHCSSPGRTFEPATFEISVERQQVTVSERGQNYQQLRECSVRSKKEWTCRSTDGSFSFGLSAGRPWLKPPSEETPRMFFMPRWQYLWESLGETRRPLTPGNFMVR
jgi:hypothetical protein